MRELGLEELLFRPVRFQCSAAVSIFRASCKTALQKALLTGTLDQVGRVPSGSGQPPTCSLFALPWKVLAKLVPARQGAVLVALIKPSKW